MNEILQLTAVDFPSLFISVFIILMGIKSIVSILEWLFDKLGLETKFMRKKREDHELLVKTSQNLSALQEKHTKDIEQCMIHDKHMKDELSVFMNEIRFSISSTQSEMKQLTDANSAKDKQINSLMAAQREVLADKINSKYKYYVSIEGIPEDEIEEFTNLHTAYKGCGGNHSGDAKYEYCMNHLPVVPVETKLKKIIPKEKLPYA